MISKNLALLKNKQPETSALISKSKSVLYKELDENTVLDDNACINFENVGICVFLGVGTGQQIINLADRRPPWCTFFVVEKDPSAIKHMFERYDCSKVIENGGFLVDVDPVTVAGHLYNRMWDIICGKYKIVINRYNDENKEYYEQTSNYIERYISNYSGEIATLIHITKQTQQNVFDNMNAITKVPGINALKGIFDKKSAIVAAAGPSLDKTIPELKKAKGEALIIAVDTALKPLQCAGITPDIVVAIDYSEKNVEKVFGADESGYYAALLPSVRPDFFKKYASNCFAFYVPNRLYDFTTHACGKKGVIKGGGSVLHSAFQLALYCGCENIALVGCDLANSGTVSHAKGSIYDGVPVAENKSLQDEKKRTFTVDAYGSTLSRDTVETTSSFYAFKTQLEAMLKDCKANVYNCTGGGAKIDGTQEVPLDYFLHYYNSTADYSVAIEMRHKLAQIEPGRVHDAKEYLIKQFHDILNMAIQAKQSAAKMVPGGDNSAIAAELSTMLDEVDQKTHEHDFIELLFLKNNYEWTRNSVLSDFYKTDKASQKKMKALVIKHLNGLINACEYYIKLCKR